MAAIMAAPTSEYICPYDLCSQKNGDYSNVQDLVLDRDAAISAAIILVSYYRIAGPRVSFGIKNVYFEGIEVSKTSI